MGKPRYARSDLLISFNVEGDATFTSCGELFEVPNHHLDQLLNLLSEPPAPLRYKAIGMALVYVRAGEVTFVTSDCDVIFLISAEELAKRIRVAQVKWQQQMEMRAMSRKLQECSGKVVRLQIRDDYTGEILWAGSEFEVP